MKKASLPYIKNSPIYVVWEIQSCFFQKSFSSGTCIVKKSLLIKVAGRSSQIIIKSFLMLQRIFQPWVYINKTAGAALYMREPILLKQNTRCV